MAFGFGQPAHRVEDFRLLRGEGRYVDDVRLPGQAHAAVLRAEVAHGRLRALDTRAARAAPGVLAVWTHEDVAGRLAPMSHEVALAFEHAAVETPRLADGRVRHVGEPIAFVVAETRHAAEDAAEMIAVEIEDLPAVVDPLAALAADAPSLHDEAPGNLAYDWSCGDAAAVERLFGEAHRVVSTPVVSQRVVVASIEPRGINVRFEDGRWEAWCSSQGVFGMRAKLARALGVAPDRVRVHTGDVGGAFGMKLMDHPEYALCALAARELGRPVKWVATRSEAFLSDAQGRDLRGTVEGAFDAEGRLLAARSDMVSGLGARPSSAAMAVHSIFSAPLLGGMYAARAMHARVRGAFTNTPPADAYRGAGRPEVIYATERLMEAGARALGIDPAEIRRRNLLTKDDVPHQSPGGFAFDSLDCRRVLDAALVSADRAGFEARAAEDAARGRARGIGVAYYFERTGGAPVEHCALDLDAEGRLTLAIGTQASGQGHETAWAQVLHDALGLPFERIRVASGDSDLLPGGGGTGGSRSAIKAGQVLTRGTADLVASGLETAASMLEAARADVEYDPATGGYRVVGTDRTVAIETVAREAGGLSGRGHVEEAVTTFPNGAHVCEVSIDRETGRASVERYTAVDDFGRLINPALVTGQVHGGVVQGIGQVLAEAAAWDESGQPLAGSFMDYALPRAADVPGFSVAYEEIETASNPLGVKGCGEAGSVGAIPATALAVMDALARAGVETVPETPFTPQVLWRALSRTAPVAVAAQ
ncbi:MAG: xanthine dehydrogenase family protein molybdopterin-binding subunit [Paracoccaceae bacterium]